MFVCLLVNVCSVNAKYKSFSDERYRRYLFRYHPQLFLCDQLFFYSDEVKL
jgi:hypothetical protein